LLVLPIRLLFPDAPRLLAFRPEDLALVLVEYFKVLPLQDRWVASRCATHWAAGYPPELRRPVARLLLDAWHWLLAHGHLRTEPVAIPPTDSADRRAAGSRAKNGHAA
jgi:hypothetical protein